MALKPVVMIFGSALVASTCKDQGRVLAIKLFSGGNRTQGHHRTDIHESLAGQALHILYNLLGTIVPGNDGPDYSILICIPQGRGRVAPLCSRLPARPQACRTAWTQTCR